MNADVDGTPACRYSERLGDTSRGARKSSRASVRATDDEGVASMSPMETSAASDL
jgi:hypothetical protein